MSRHHYRHYRGGPIVSPRLVFGLTAAFLLLQIYAEIAGRSIPTPPVRVLPNLEQQMIQEYQRR